MIPSILIVLLQLRFYLKEENYEIQFNYLMYLLII